MSKKKNDEEDLYDFFVKNQYKIFFVTVIVCLIVGCYDYERTCKILKKDMNVIEYLMLDKSYIKVLTFSNTVRKLGLN